MGWLETLNAAVAELNAAQLELPADPEPLAVRATLEPKDVQLPGVWIRLDGLQGPVLSGSPSGVLVTVYCAVATGDLPRSLEQLEQLLDDVSALIPPMSDPRHVALALPGQGTPATAMSYAHQLIID